MTIKNFIPANSGFFVLEFADRDGVTTNNIASSDFVKLPVVAWGIDINADFNDDDERALSAVPITVEIRSHELLLLMPDGSVIEPEVRHWANFDSFIDAIRKGNFEPSWWRTE